MEGRVEIFETYPKSEEIVSFYPVFASADFYILVAIALSRSAMF